MTLKSTACRITSYCVAALHMVVPDIQQCQVFIVSTPEYVQYIRDTIQTLMVCMGCDLTTQIVVMSLEETVDILDDTLPGILRECQWNIMEDPDVLLSEEHKEMTYDYFQWLPDGVQVILSSSTT